jgi:hypothetical protein
MTALALLDAWRKTEKPRMVYAQNEVRRSQSAYWLGKERCLRNVHQIAHALARARCASLAQVNERVLAACPSLAQPYAPMPFMTNPVRLLHVCLRDAVVQRACRVSYGLAGCT